MLDLKDYRDQYALLTVLKHALQHMDALRAADEVEPPQTFTMNLRETDTTNLNRARIEISDWQNLPPAEQLIEIPRVVASYNCYLKAIAYQQITGPLVIAQTDDQYPTRYNTTYTFCWLLEQLLRKLRPDFSTQSACNRHLRLNNPQDRDLIILVLCAAPKAFREWEFTETFSRLKFKNPLVLRVAGDRIDEWIASPRESKLPQLELILERFNQYIDALALHSLDSPILIRNRDQSYKPTVVFNLILGHVVNDLAEVLLAQIPRSKLMVTRFHSALERPPSHDHSTSTAATVVEPKHDHGTSTSTSMVEPHYDASVATPSKM